MGCPEQWQREKKQVAAGSHKLDKFCLQSEHVSALVVEMTLTLIGLSC